MNILPTFLLCLYGAAVFTGCETTGDPYQDTIFFSQRKADLRLAAKRARLDDLEKWATEADVQLHRLNEQLHQAQESAHANGAELQSLEARINGAKQRLAGIRTRASLGADDSEMETLQRRRVALETEITGLNDELINLLEVR
jgi:predicted  nucleic acid-binding Zn-ribbon protein